MIKGTLINIFLATVARLKGSGKYYGKRELLKSGTQDKLQSSINNYYAKKFLSENRVSANKKVLYVSKNCKKLMQAESNSYDVVILENTLNYTYDYFLPIKEAKRVLKKGGELLATAYSVASSYEQGSVVWGFADAGIRYIFEKNFSKKDIRYKGYGNALIGRYLLANLSISSLSAIQKDYYDPYFSIVIGVRVIK